MRSALRANLKTSGTRSSETSAARRITSRQRSSRLLRRPGRFVTWMHMELHAFIDDLDDVAASTYSVEYLAHARSVFHNLFVAHHARASLVVRRLHADEPHLPVDRPCLKTKCLKSRLEMCRVCILGPVAMAFASPATSSSSEQTALHRSEVRRDLGT